MHKHHTLFFIIICCCAALLGCEPKSAAETTTIQTEMPFLEESQTYTATEITIISTEYSNNETYVDNTSSKESSPINQEPPASLEEDDDLIEYPTTGIETQDTVPPTESPFNAGEF